jgi:hypothetical protein
MRPARPPVGPHSLSEGPGPRPEGAMSIAQGRPKGEFPLGGTARSAKGAA